MPTQTRQLIALLRDKDFRDHFTADQIYELLAAQVRLLREKRHWTQEELGARAGMHQVQVSRVEDPDYKGARLTTLSKLANAFDVALIVRFAPFSELADWLSNLSPDAFEPAAFDEESWAYQLSQGGHLDALVSMMADSNIVVFETHKQRVSPSSDWQTAASEWQSAPMPQREPERATA